MSSVSECDIPRRGIVARRRQEVGDCLVWDSLMGDCRNKKTKGKIAGDCRVGYCHGSWRFSANRARDCSKKKKKKRKSSLGIHPIYICMVWRHPGVDTWPLLFRHHGNQHLRFVVLRMRAFDFSYPVHNFWQCTWTRELTKNSSNRRLGDILYDLCHYDLYKEPLYVRIGKAVIVMLADCLVLAIY